MHRVTHCILHHTQTTLVILTGFCGSIGWTIRLDGPHHNLQPGFGSYSLFESQEEKKKKLL